LSSVLYLQVVQEKKKQYTDSKGL